MESAEPETPVEVALSIIMAHLNSLPDSEIALWLAEKRLEASTDRFVESQLQKLYDIVPVEVTNGVAQVPLPVANPNSPTALAFEIMEEYHVDEDDLDVEEFEVDDFEVKPRSNLILPDDLKEEFQQEEYQPPNPATVEIEIQRETSLYGAIFLSNEETPINHPTEIPVGDGITVALTPARGLDQVNVIMYVSDDSLVVELRTAQRETPLSVSYVSLEDLRRKSKDPGYEGSQTIKIHTEIDTDDLDK